MSHFERSFARRDAPVRPRVTRRRMVGMTSAALAAPLTPAIARAQQDEASGTPAQADDLAADGSLAGLSESASATATDILTYWYTGYFEGNPVENRAQIFFGLPVWGTVPYATQPTLCKAFGYWAGDPGVES